MHAGTAAAAAAAAAAVCAAGAVRGEDAALLGVGRWGAFGDGAEGKGAAGGRFRGLVVLLRCLCVLDNRAVVVLMFFR